MKRILVTGGTGFIGSHTCEALLRLGYSVIIVDNMNDYYNPQYKRDNLKCILDTAQKAGFSAEIMFYEIDIRDKIGLSKIFSTHNIDAVIHLAAYAGVRPSIKSPTLYVDVNINGTLNILECMKNNEIRQLVFASSSSIYGNNTKIPFSEDDFVDFPISPYAATKKAGELLCHTYHHLYNINVACLRFFTVFGPRQRPDLAIYKFTKLIYEGSPVPFYGDGSMRRDYTYVTDTLDGILKALYWVENNEKRFELFNLGESCTISLLQMVEAIEKVTGKKAKLALLSMQPGDVKITFADNQKSKKILGYNPSVTFEAGLEKFYEWFCSNRVGQQKLHEYKKF